MTTIRNPANLDTMGDAAWIRLIEDAPAVRIPSGESVVLEAGTEVRITQSLGGSFTIATRRGSMGRIDGRHAGALGIALPEKPAHPSASSAARDVEEQIWGELRQCYDPEIPVNIVDLGLVYGCTLATGRDGGQRAEVRLTLTSPGCSMGGVLIADIEDKVGAVEGVDDVRVELVFDPPWSQERMSEAAKLELGLL